MCKLTVYLVPRGKKANVGQGNPSTISIVKLHHHGSVLLLFSWAACTDATSTLNVHVSNVKGITSHVQSGEHSPRYLFGRIQGTNTLSVRSNKHTLLFRWWEHPRHPVARLKPAETDKELRCRHTKQNAQQIYNLTEENTNSRTDRKPEPNSYTIRFLIVIWFQRRLY